MRKAVGTSTTSRAPVEDLQAWARATEEEIAELRGELQPLEERMASARERLDLIRRLIGLAEAPRTPSEVRNAEDSVGAAGTLTNALEAQIEAILAEGGEPMHIAKLREALIERGVPLPGRGDEANIIVRLRRDGSRFTRTGRGTYGLAIWGLPEITPTRTRIVRKREAARK